MTTLEKKALELISDKLTNFDTYPIYKSIYDILEENNINADIKKEILTTLQTESSKLKNVIVTARDWVDTVINNK